MKNVLYAINPREVTVVNFFHLQVRKLDLGCGWTARSRDAKKGVKGVGAALDLLDPAILDHAEVEHTTIGRADLHTVVELGTIN